MHIAIVYICVIMIIIAIIVTAIYLSKCGDLCAVTLSNAT
jgi:hypothetical protein